MIMIPVIQKLRNHFNAWSLSRDFSRNFCLQSEIKRFQVSIVELNITALRSDQQKPLKSSTTRCYRVIQAISTRKISSLNDFVNLFSDISNPSGIWLSMKRETGLGLNVLSGFLLDKLWAGSVKSRKSICAFSSLSNYHNCNQLCTLAVCWMMKTKVLNV